MTPNASNKGICSVWGPYFGSYVCLACWGWGFQKESPILCTTIAGGKHLPQTLFFLIGPMGGGCLDTIGAEPEAENSAVNFQKNQYHHCRKKSVFHHFSTPIPKSCVAIPIALYRRQIGPPARNGKKTRHRQVTDLDVTVLGFSGPGLPSARQVLCGDAPRLFCIILVCI